MTIIKFRKCTQAQYDALQPPRNSAILYFISDRGWFYLGDTKYYSGTSETGLYLKLDANGKINLAYLYDSVLGQMEYAGTFDPTAGYPSITNALDPNRAPRKGDYFIATGTGTIEGTEFKNKDWLIKSEDGWQHIDNTDAVASVNGKMGVVVLDGTDIQLGGGVTTTIQAKFIAIDQSIADLWSAFASYYTKAQIDAIITQYYTKDQMDTTVLEIYQNVDDTKVDKVDGKALSTNDYTDEEKALVATIPSISLKNGEQDKQIATIEENLRRVNTGEVNATAVGERVVHLGKDVANAPLKVETEGLLLNAPDLEYVRNNRVFKIEMDAGLMDFGVSSGTVTWYFPDGTTSTALHPAKTLATAGTVYLIHNDFSNSTLQLTDNDTPGKYKGSLSDLPALTYYLSLSYNSLVTGSLSDLPALTYYLNLAGCGKVTGSLSDLPALTNTLNLADCGKVTGSYTSVSGNNVPTTTVLNWTGLSATDMDDTLIAYAATTKSNGTFTAIGKKRTSASDAAIATLEGRGWTISGITKV